MRDNWKTMRPSNVKAWSIMITGIVTLALLRWYDPEGMKPVDAILKYVWVLIPAWILNIIVEVKITEWFGLRTSEGEPVKDVDPIEARLDSIEAAINRLYSYAQELDPELAEELRLKREFMRGDGSIFAGMNYHDYIRDQRAAGKRTLGSDSIWTD